MRSWARVFVPALILAQVVIVRWAAGEERPPALPAISNWAEFREWKAVSDDPIDPAVVRVLGADRLVSKTYLQPASGAQASLFFAWFQSQRGGASQPHSPQVCLPGSGWTPLEIGELTIDTSAGPIRVNRYVVSNQGLRAVVLYWYQTPRRAVAGEWASKFWTVAGALRDRRTDISLVRLVAWSAPGEESHATATAAGLASAVYPLVRESLPR